MPIARTHTLRAGLLTVLLAGALAPANAQDAAAPAPVLAYNFNQAEGPYPSAGTLALPLDVHGKNQTHGAPGSGVSGLPGDRAWDCSANTLVGYVAQAPAPNDSALFTTPKQALFPEGTRAFTLTFWFKADQSLSEDSSVRFFFNANRITPPIDEGMLLRNLKGRLELRIATRNADGKPEVAVFASALPEPDKGFNQAHKWVFVAIVWDGATVRYYCAGPQSPLTYMGSKYFTGPITPSGKPLIIGNVGGFDRGFDGLIDNLRLYYAAVPAPQLEILRTQAATTAQ